MILESQYSLAVNGMTMNARMSMTIKPYLSSGIGKMAISLAYVSL